MKSGKKWVQPKYRRGNPKEKKQFLLVLQFYPLFIKVKLSLKSPSFSFMIDKALSFNFEN
jgi:hypothetical protein